MSRQDNVDYWEKEINSIEERCDLNGLLKQEYKNKIVLSQYDEIKQSKVKSIEIDEELFRSLKLLCSNHGLTLNSILQFVWHKLLSVYGNSKDTVIGTTVSGRNLPVNDIENSVGLFINTLPLVMKHSNETILINAIRTIQDKINEMICRSNVDLSDLNKGNMKHGLFDVLFVFENYPVSEIEPVSKQLNFHKLYDVEKLDYPLTIVAFETTRESVMIVAHYADELFEEDTINDILEVAKLLLIQIGGANETTRISDLKCLTNSTYEKIQEWNNTDKNLGEKEEKTLNQLFEEEVEISGDKIAVVYEDTKLSYRELNERANQLANYLRSCIDLKPDSIIALLLDKNELMIVSIIAIWKAGAAYVPIDPSYPDDRIKFILNDTKAKLIIANDEYITRLKSFDIVKIGINSIKLNQQMSKLYLARYSTKNNLAYVTYTSGTTGNPKGVMKEHVSVVNGIVDLTQKYNLNRENSEKIVLFSSYVFEPFVRQLLMTLLNSHSLIIAKDDSSYNTSKFCDFLKHHEVTYLNGTASVLQLFNYSECKTLKRLIFAGEELTEQCYNKIRKSYQNTIINEYGPTEVALVSTMKIFDSSEERKNRSIGKSLANVKCYVLDSNLSLLPIGSIGELYIGGIGVARGYLNRPELTAERFLRNPFQTETEKSLGKNERIYKTGDLVRWLPNGEIEYLGRNDFQVKIRGLRIELGEIETVISSYSGVNQCVVLAVDHKRQDESITKNLIAYYVSFDDLDEEDLVQFIQSKLPNYMIPNYFRRIEQVPLTINGKLDTRKLPKIELSFENKLYVAPRNDIEAQLCHIWSTILGIDKVGITDDFFRLGGDSIRSMQIAGQVWQKMRLNVAIKDIFVCKTIEKLFDTIMKFQINETQKKSNFSFVDLDKSVKINDLFPFYNDIALQMGPKNHNRVVVIETPQLTLNIVQNALCHLINQHDVLRISFNNSLSVNLIPFENPICDLNKLVDEFDLENGAMFKAAYTYDETGLIKLFFIVHGMLAESNNLALIREDLKHILKGDQSVNSVNNYNDWLNNLRIMLKKSDSTEMVYWENILNPRTVTLFNEKLTLNRQVKNKISEAKITLTDEMNYSLLNNCNFVYNTKLEHLLLTALSYTLREQITQLEANYLMIEASCRESERYNMQRTVGMFYFKFPIMLEAVADDIGSSIVKTKEHLKQIPLSGMGFGAFIEDKKSFILPKVAFNYYGEGKEPVEWIKDTPLDRVITENIIEIDSFTIDGSVHVNIRTKFTTEETYSFANAFQTNLEMIIKYLISMNRSFLTISDVDYVIKNKDYLNKLQENEVEAIFLANSLQQGFLYNSLKHDVVNNDAYIVQSVYEYKAIINEEILKLSWELTQKRYSSLRLRFEWQHELIQIIDKHQSFDWRYINIENENSENQCAKLLKEILDNDRKEGFKLNKGNLFRVYLIKQKTNLFTMILSFHHIILDGWSVALVIEYVHRMYLQMHEKSAYTLTPLPSDTTYENAQKYRQMFRHANVDYWEKEINSIEERCDLNGLLKQEYKNKIVLSQYDEIKQSKVKSIEIDEELFRSLKLLCSNHGLTLNSILQFVWHKLLSVYGNSKDTVIGTTVSGRNLPVNDIENSVGLFINTLPLVMKHSNETILINAIRTIQDKINEMICRSNVDLSDLNKGNMKHGLFDVLFVFENYPVSEIEPVSKQLNFHKLYDVEKLDYPLTIVAFETTRESVMIVAHYADELFEEDTIDDILGVAKLLLTQIGCANETTRISDLKCLTNSTFEKIQEWNNTDKNLGEKEEKTLNQIFEEEVETSGDKIAVVYEDTKLSYRELNERANQLANYLRSCIDLKPDSIIALLLDKSELMIVSIIAIWKAGAAYVPIDPSYPHDRIKFILNDTKAKLIIANDEYIERLKSFDIVKIGINSIKLNEQMSKHNLAKYSTKNNLAYVIYTSGTTGNPKGVMIEHIGVVNLIVALTKLFKLRAISERVLSFSNYVFDHFVEQMCDALLNSQTLVVLNDEMRVDKERLYDYINKNQVTYLSGTPSVLQEYDYENLNSITRIDAVGEDFSEAFFNKIRSKFSGLIINGYGPTEISITSHKKVYYLEKKRTDKSIGKWLANLKCYVLDSNLSLLPIGSIGELYIGGIGVARGYLNRPELTAVRFLRNPFQTEIEKSLCKNERIYKTGDLVRWLPNGEIEYLGRNDFQVKIRGLRIELGEIESVLSSFPGVQNSVVVARDSKKLLNNSQQQKYLIGYYTSANDLVESEIKNYMESKLPKYMIPNRLIRIPKIVVNINGKLDTKALPDVDFTNEKQNKHVEAKNEIQLKLCELWSELLNIPAHTIGINDDFFSLGGDSILVIKLSIMLKKVFAKENTVPVIFHNTTIFKLSEYLTKSDSIESNELKLENKNERFQSKNSQLSFAQERLLFITKFDEAGIRAYNIPFCIMFSNGVRKDILYQSLLSILYRHEILRTLIREDEEGNFCQHIVNETEIHSMFQIERICIVNEQELDKELNKLSNYTFDLKTQLPIRVAFYEMKASNRIKYYLGILVHHICFDGWSWAVFSRDLSAFYDYYEEVADTFQGKLKLSPLPIQYKDFAVMQRKHLQGKRFENLLDFWKEKLNGFEPLNLCIDCPRRPIIHDYTGKNVYFELDEKTSAALKELARNLKISLFSLLLSAYTIVLSIYSNQQDVIVGTPVANRNHADLENLIGLFVNMLPLRIKVEYNLNVVDFIERVSKEVIEAQLHQDMPFEQLVKELEVENDSSRHPIIQVLLVMNNHLEAKDFIEESSCPRKLEIKDYIQQNNEFCVAKYDLTVCIDRIDNQLQGHFNYAMKLYHENTIDNLLQSYVSILDQFSKITNDSKMNELNFVTGKQLNQIHNWNNTDTNLGEKEEKTLNQLFEEEVETSGDKIAVVYEDTKLSYRELNERANQLANYLRSCIDLKPDSIIALLLDKSELMILSIIAIWKAGAAYVPIDPSYPDDRINFIINDTKSKLIIANDDYMERLKSFDIVKIGINSIKLDEQMSKLNLAQYSTKNNLAYVIYTSGTTGNPKGVLIEHIGVVNLIVALTKLFKLRAISERVLSFSNYVFDHFVEQLCLTLLNSQTLVVLNDEMRIDKERLYDYINKNQVTYLSGTPSVLQEYDYENLESIIRIDAVGEDFSEAVYNKIRSKFNGLITNGYGPSETTIASNKKLYFLEEKRSNKSIGKSLANVKCYVLYSNLSLLPIGSIGELYIGGIGVARGYLNRPEVTAERFLRNPFQTETEKSLGKNERIYKTGDLVRWLPNGEIEYLGRNDFQVKIRGLRIELGEIETIISSYSGVKQCVVLAVDHKRQDESITKNLIAYYVSFDDLDEEDLVQFIQSKLPNYMIPNYFRRIEQVPLTINGKLDTRKLPKIELSFENKLYVAPRNDIEAQLCHIWSTILGIDKVGITDDFFRLGGDSISSLQLLGRVKKQLNRSISIKDVFKFRTIKGIYNNCFSNKIRNTNDASKIKLSESGFLVGELPLLPVQEWFFQKHNSKHWNQSFLIETPPLDPSRLKECLQSLIVHHDIFRLRFKHLDCNKYTAYYIEEIPNVSLNVLDVDTCNSYFEKQLHTTLTEWQSHFDLENGPLFAVGYLTGFADGTQKIWFSMHHLIVDAVSWRIICEDLQQLYKGLDLGEKSNSYRQWSQSVVSYGLKNAAIEKCYWFSMLDKIPDFNDNLTKHNELLSETTMSEIELTSTQTSMLLRNCTHTYDMEINCLLLTAFSYALMELSKDRRNYAVLEGHGREDIDNGDEISRTVGWFTTLYPVSLVIGDSLASTILNIKEHLNQIPYKGIGYGTIIGYKDHKLPRVSFNYLGQFESSNKSSSERWCLKDGIVGDEVSSRFGHFHADDLLAVNGSCKNGKMQFNIKSRFNNEKTNQFAKTFSSVLQNIIELPKNTFDSHAIHQPYVTFNDTHSDYKTLFVLPPGEGGSESYFNNIAPQLSDFKLILFNNYYLYLKSSKIESLFSSIETLAAYYIKYIKKIQPIGPYYFIGWSFGGVLSFEISRQLCNAGDQIAMMCLIDSFFGVKKAIFDIGRSGEMLEVDQINVDYCPDIRKERFATSLKTINTGFFKAMKCNDKCSSDLHLALFKYYLTTKYNNFEQLIPASEIQLFQMEDDSHMSWIYNKEQISKICNYISTTMKTCSNNKLF